MKSKLLGEAVALLETWARLDFVGHRLTGPFFAKLRDQKARPAAGPARSRSRRSGR